MAGRKKRVDTFDAPPFEDGRHIRVATEGSSKKALVYLVHGSSILVKTSFNYLPSKDAISGRLKLGSASLVLDCVLSAISNIVDDSGA